MACSGTALPFYLFLSSPYLSPHSYRILSRLLYFRRPIFLPLHFMLYRWSHYTIRYRIFCHPSSGGSWNEIYIWEATEIPSTLYRYSKPFGVNSDMCYRDCHVSKHEDKTRQYQSCDPYSSTILQEQRTIKGENCLHLVMHEFLALS
jgi:hypothetical protein